MRATLIILASLPITLFSQVDEQAINTTIRESIETRKNISGNIKERTPANSSISSWNDFENEMKSDKNWENQIDEIIKEYE